MLIIKRIGVLSLGKFFMVLYGGLGLIAGLLTSFFSLVGMGLGSALDYYASSRSSSGYGGAGALGGLVTGPGAIVCFPLLYGIIGFLGGLITALIDNLSFKLMGELELEVEPHGNCRWKITFDAV
jgi:hypothetical protein